MFATENRTCTLSRARDELGRETVDGLLPRLPGSFFGFFLRKRCAVVQIEDGTARGLLEAHAVISDQAAVLGEIVGPETQLLSFLPPAVAAIFPPFSFGSSHAGPDS